MATSLLWTTQGLGNSIFTHTPALWLGRLSPCQSTPAPCDATTQMAYASVRKSKHKKIAPTDGPMFWIACWGFFYFRLSFLLSNFFTALSTMLGLFFTASLMISLRSSMRNSGSRLARVITVARNSLVSATFVLLYSPECPAKRPPRNPRISPRLNQDICFLRDSAVTEAILVVQDFS